MIQRVQTIWLLLASAFILALFLFPYAQFTDNSGMAHALKVNGQFVNEEGVLVKKGVSYLKLILALVLGLMPLYIIVQFKNLALQRRLIGVLAILLLAYFAWLVFTVMTAIEALGLAFAVSQLGVGLVLLLIALVFLWMAAQGVRKDIRLLKSADRLR